MKFKKMQLLLIMMIMVIVFGACANGKDINNDMITKKSTYNTDKSIQYKKITPEEVKKRILENNQIIIVDVRTESEFKEKHIEGAILIPNESITDSMPNQLPNLHSEILLYCRSGNRSRQAAEKLISLGYTQVYDFGGIIDWPYDTVSLIN